MTLSVIKHSKFWLTFSAGTVVVSLLLLAIFGLNLSPDFAEGTIMKLAFVKTVENSAVVSELNTLAPTLETDTVKLGAPSVRTLSDGTTSIRTLRLDDATQAKVLTDLEQKLGKFEVREVRNISPTYAQTFITRTIIAVLIASLAIIAFIAWAFKDIPRSYSPWRFGVSAIVALVHDLIFTMGVFILLGIFLGVEIDGLFVTAMLTVLGYSVNDTIVIFDRIRENLKGMRRDQTFGEIADASIRQTFTRSINTALSTIIMLVCLFILGPESIRWFTFALICGIVTGTFSSIFIAPTLLSLWQQRSGRKA